MTSINIVEMKKKKNEKKRKEKIIAKTNKMFKVEE